MSDYGMSPELMAARFTPREAARIKADTFMLRCATDAESLRISDQLMNEDGGHGWFVYCLDTVARRTS